MIMIMIKYIGDIPRTMYFKLFPLINIIFFRLECLFRIDFFHVSLQDKSIKSSFGRFYFIIN